jgi:hypothetical protein
VVTDLVTKIYNFRVFMNQRNRFIVGTTRAREELYFLKDGYSSE